ncbi:MAG: hypothetical protein V1668_01435 [Patescibacteria group bacterium]
MANAKELIPVGQVFGTFKTNDEGNVIIGIQVTDHPFGTGNSLFLRPADKPEKLMEIKVSTLELNRTRTNVALPGGSYGVKPFLSNGTALSAIPEPGWQVLVRANQSDGAAKRQPKTWPRPPRYEVKKLLLGQIR